MLKHSQKLISEAYKNSVWCSSVAGCEEGYDSTYNELIKTEKVISYECFKDKLLNIDIINEESVDIENKYNKYKEKYNLDDKNVYDNLKNSNEYFYFLSSYNNYYDFLENTIPYTYNGKIKLIQMELFLHGYCDVFAYLLAKKLGCNVVTYNILDEDGNLSDLMHAFCEVKEFQAYADIRGISNSYDMSNILNYYDDTYWESYEYDQYEMNFMNAEEAKNFFINECNLNSDRYDDSNELVKEVNEFIELFIEKYDINIQNKNK